MGGGEGPPTGLGRGEGPQLLPQGAARPLLSCPVGACLGFWGGERCGRSQERIWNRTKLCGCGFACAPEGASCPHRVLLSGDLGAVSFQGESVVCRVGSPRKAGWQHQLQSVARRNASCRAKKQGQSPALGQVAWLGQLTVPGCRPGHSKALCSPRKSPEQTGCAAVCPACPELLLRVLTSSIHLGACPCIPRPAGTCSPPTFPTELDWCQY